MGRKEVFGSVVSLGLMGLIGNTLQNHYVPHSGLLDQACKTMEVVGFVPAIYLALEPPCKFTYHALSKGFERLENLIH